MKTRTILFAMLVLSGCSKKENDAGGTPVPTAAPAPQAAERGRPELPPGHPPTLAGGGQAHPEGKGGKMLEATADGRKQLGSFVLAPPAGWDERKTTSSMRAAEWKVPGEAGDAELVVYHFGAGGAGGVQANLDRWIGQFKQADGSASKDKAKIEETKVAGQKATLVTLDGHYVAAVRPGAAELHDKPEYSLAAAIVDAPEGPYYFKMVGPKATVAAQREAFLAMVSGMELPVTDGAAAGKPTAADKAAKDAAKDAKKATKDAAKDAKKATKDAAKDEGGW